MSKSPARNIYNFDPNDLPADIRAAIGLLIAASAQTEHILEAAIMGVLTLDSEYGMAVTTHMPVPLRMSVLRSAAEIRLEVSQLDELDELLRSIQSAIDDRNTTVHGRWCKHPITGQVFTTKQSARVSVQAELIPQTVDKIEAEASEIFDAGMKLWSFLSTNGLIPAIPPPRPRGHKSKAARKKHREAGLA